MGTPPLKHLREDSHNVKGHSPVFDDTGTGEAHNGCSRHQKGDAESEWRLKLHSSVSAYGLSLLRYMGFLEGHELLSTQHSLPIRSRKPSHHRPLSRIGVESSKSYLCEELREGTNITEGGAAERCERREVEES